MGVNPARASDQALEERSGILVRVSSAFSRALAARGVTLAGGDASLGEGGQGWVLRGTSAAGEVAVKRLKSSTPARRMRFQREIALMRRLSTAGVGCVVPVLGALEDGEYLAYWMPLYHEGSLQSAMNRQAVSDPLILIRRLVVALGELHSHGVSHRDLKPDNVLVDGDDLVLADLGLALEAEPDAVRLTESGEQVGPRLYVAPELVDGIHDNLDHRPADLYSMSKIIWCLLSHRRWPFDRESRHWEMDQLPSFTNRNPDLRPLEELARNWMSFEASGRTATFDAMLSAIDYAENPPRPIQARAGRTVNPNVVRALEVAGDAARAQAERERREHVQSAEAAEAARIEAVTSWWHSVLRPRVPAVTTESEPSKLLDEYLRIPNALEYKALPVDESIFLSGDHLPQSGPQRMPLTTPWRYGPWFFQGNLYSVAIGIPGRSDKSTRQFTLHALMGTQEIRLKLVELEGGADDPLTSEPVEPCVYLPVLVDSTCDHAGAMAVRLIERLLDFIEDVAMD